MREPIIDRRLSERDEWHGCVPTFNSDRSEPLMHRPPPAVMGESEASGTTDSSTSRVLGSVEEALW